VLLLVRPKPSDELFSEDLRIGDAPPRGLDGDASSSSPRPKPPPVLLVGVLVLREDLRAEGLGEAEGL
jgi:hypothetical protein